MRHKRDDIVVIQNLGIFLVVLGHSYPLGEQPPLYYWIRNWIYGFHMPLFFFISGYLFLYTNKDIIKINIKEFIIKKFKRIILPYILLSTLAFGPKVLFSIYAFRPINFTMGDYLHGLIYPLENPIALFWFLPTLFIIFILALFLWRIFSPQKNEFIIIIFSILFLIITIFNPLNNVKFLNFSGVAFYFLFFWLGSLLCVYANPIEKIFEKPTVLLFTFLLTLILNMPNKGNMIELVTSVIGIAMSFSFAKFCVKNNLKFLHFLDGYYYQIFLLSWFYQMFARTLLSNILQLGFYPAGISMLVAGIFLPILTAKFINNRIPALKITIGL